MNVQTYKSCIQSLQKQIKSKDQQRKSMQMTIQNLDKQLSQYVNKNQQLREENSYLNRTKDSLLLQVKKKEDIISEKNSLLTSNQSSDTQIRQNISVLQMQKASLEQQLKQKQTMLSEKNIKIRDFDSQTRKNASLIQGYKGIVNQKARQLARVESKVRQVQQQKQVLNKQISTLRSSYQNQKQNLFQIKQAQGNANQSLRDQQIRISQLLAEIQQLKLFHSNQIQTLRFNHTEQTNKLQKQKLSLKGVIEQYAQKVTQLESVNAQLQRQYQKQSLNKDEVVNNLINQINFLKTEKSDTQKQLQLKQEQITREIIKMGLQTSVYQSKINKFQTQIRQLKQTISLKDNQIINLQKQIQSIQSTIAVSTQQRQTQIQNSLQTKFNLQTKLNQTQQRLKQSQLLQLQLRQQIKQLTYQKSSTNTSKAGLSELVKSHEFTITKLQELLQQSKKIISQINKLLQTKTRQIQSLQLSNTMFRNQKIQWIRRQQQYRKKIVEYRNTTLSNNKSYRESVINKGSNKSFIDFGKKVRQSQALIGQSNQQQNIFRAAGLRTKTLAPSNSVKNIDKLVGMDYISGGSSRVSSQSNQDMSLQFKPSIHSIKSNQVQSGQNLMKKRDIRYQFSPQKENQNQSTNQINQENNQIEHVYSSNIQSSNGIHSLLEKLNKE